MVKKFIGETISVLLLCNIVLAETSSKFFSCNGSKKNVTILRYMEPTSSQRFFHSSTLQLTYLAKSLFDIPCIDVWMYSPARKLSIQLTQETLDHFMGNIMESSLALDGSEIEFLTNYAQADDSNEQILLVIMNQDHPTSISNELKRIHAKSNMNVIIWCGEPLTSTRHITCNEARNWLPARQIINCGSDHFQPHFDPFLHKIFLDLIQNIDYDYYQQFNDFKCNGTEELDIFVRQSARYHKHRYTRTFFLASLLQNKFPRTNVYVVISFYENVYFYSSAKNFFQNWVMVQSAKYASEMSEFLKR